MAKKMMLDEKRTKILEIFDKYKTFFKIQELEKIGSKEKGIVENTIKDVTMGLYYDDLICSEKVGTSVYFWSNYNKKLLDIIKDTKRLEEENNDLRNKISIMKDEYTSEMNKKEMTSERINKIKELERLSEEIREIEKNTEGYNGMCKDEYDEKMKGLGEMISKINRNTDNIFIIQDYVCKKFNIEKDVVNKSFNISDELDYVE